MSSRTTIWLVLLLAGLAALSTVLWLIGNRTTDQAESAERDLFGAPAVDDPAPGPQRALPDPRPLPPEITDPEPEEPWEPPEILASGG